MTEDKLITEQDKEIELNVLDRDLPLSDLDNAVASVDGVHYKSGYENVLDPVTGALIICAVLAGSKLIIRLWNEFRGGTVIDLTTEPIKVYRDKGLEYGFFVVHTKDGEAKIEAHDEPKDSLERMVSGWLGAGKGATVDKIKELAKEALRADKPTHN